MMVLLFLVGVQVRPDQGFRLAVGSFIEDHNNRVEIITRKISKPYSQPRSSLKWIKRRTCLVCQGNASTDRHKVPLPSLSRLLPLLAVDEARGALVAQPHLSFAHPYPPTKLAFIPDRAGSRPDLLASSGDYLRIWRLSPDGVAMEKLLNAAKTPEAAAPITSFDWNEIDVRRVGTASIDTTCTVWDVERGVVETQLIAHDREVYDFAWGGAGVFASVSADASVRVFDMRDKEHSTIIYEAPNPDTPLLRLAWNKHDPRYLATIALDSAKVFVLDIRFPSMPVAELARHQAPVNAIAWAPHSAMHLCSVADDAHALIWDLAGLPMVAGQPPLGAAIDPFLSYNAGAEVNQLQWSAAHPEWVAICFGNKTQVLRV